MTKRSYGDGGIDQRGENSFRLRYRIGKHRYSVTFQGTLAEAKKELRALLRSGDTGEHVAPDKGTLAEWAREWIEVGAPGHYRFDLLSIIVTNLSNRYAISRGPGLASGWPWKL